VQPEEQKVDRLARNAPVVPKGYREALVSQKQIGCKQKTIASATAYVGRHQRRNISVHRTIEKAHPGEQAPSTIHPMSARRHAADIPPPSFRPLSPPKMRLLWREKKRYVYARAAAIARSVTPRYAIAARRHCATRVANASATFDGGSSPIFFLILARFFTAPISPPPRSATPTTHHADVCPDAMSTIHVRHHRFAARHHIEEATSPSSKRVAAACQRKSEVDANSSYRHAAHAAPVGIMPRDISSLR